MTRSVSLSVVCVLVGCGSPVSTSPGADASSGAVVSSTGVDTSSGGVATPSSSSGAGDETTAVTTGVDTSSDSTGSDDSQCQVEVEESVAVSPERFGGLTLAAGRAGVIVLGARGWVLTGSVDAPSAERLIETDAPLLAGRFGPGGALAFAQLDDQLVTVQTIDDAPTSTESMVPNEGLWVVGDIDADGLDDLVVTSDGRIVVWRADGAGGFEALVSSAKGESAALFGHAPATPWAPPAVLVADGSSGEGIVGFEAGEDLLEKAYTIDVALAWWAGGVPPLREASREVLYATEDGVLRNPENLEVGLVVGQDGEWLRRRHRFAAMAATQPRAFDLDHDGTLDALVGTIDDNRLIGACTVGDFDLVPCLDVALQGAPESIAVDEDGQVFVATEAAGLWVYRLGACA